MARFFRSIRTQLMFIVILCYLVPVLVLGLNMNSVLNGPLLAKTEAALTTGAENAWTLTEQKVRQVISLARDATYDGELTENFALLTSGAITDDEFLRRSRSYIDRKYSREESLTFAAYFAVSDPELIIANSTGRAAADQYPAGVHKAVLALGETLDTGIAFIQDGDACFLVRNLLNARMERYGMLVLGLDMPRLLSPVSALADSWGASCMFTLDRIRYARAPEGAEPPAEADALPDGLHELPGQKALVYVRTGTDSRDVTERMELTVSRLRVYGEIDEYRRLMLLLILLLIPALTLTALFLHHRIIQPITRMSDAAKRIESGEFGVTVPVRSRDELGQLGNTFSRMSRRLRELIDKTYKEELALRDAKLQALQSRINPHFINNALEAINWQARIDGSEKASGMIGALSTLLDAGMSRNNRHIVTLEEENRVTEAYLCFIRLRYGARLTVDCDVPADLLGCRLPLLTVQPLLENAVEHGISPVGGGTILLRCFREADDLHILVRNSGKPLDEKDREQIRLALSEENQETGHLGLHNIATRLRILYDGKARISVGTDGEGMTAAEVILPLTAVPDEGKDGNG